MKKSKKKTMNVCQNTQNKPRLFQKQPKKTTYGYFQQIFLYNNLYTILKINSKITFKFDFKYGKFKKKKRKK